jgi:hypothetical protein
MLRLYVFALAALLAAVYGLVRHYTTPALPMYRTVTPPPAPTYDADAGEIPVPEMFLSDGGGT